MTAGWSFATWAACVVAAVVFAGRLASGVRAGRRGRPSRPATTRPGLRRRTAVYELDDAAGRVVRVGIAYDIPRRMARYRRDARRPGTHTSRWWWRVAGPVPARFTWYEDRPTARREEVARIARYRPVGNTQDVPKVRSYA
jgi:hypothetical protein